MQPSTPVMVSYISQVLRLQVKQPDKTEGEGAKTAPAVAGTGVMRGRPPFTKCTHPRPARQLQH